MQLVGNYTFDRLNSTSSRSDLSPYRTTLNTKLCFLLSTVLTVKLDYIIIIIIIIIIMKYIIIVNMASTNDR